MANRMSSLPIAEYCGLSPQIHTADMLAGRQSTAFHAKAAGDPGWVELAVGLPPEMRDELATWVVPGTYGAPYQHIRWAETTREQAITCPDTGAEGHPDSWAIDNGIIVVVDIKRTRFTSPVDSLQMLGYGRALARIHKARGYHGGQYYPTSGEWSWQRQPIMLGSFEDLDIAQRLAHAAANTHPTTGPHCDDCYGAHRCPEYITAAVEGLSAPDVEISDDESAARAVERLQLAKGLVKALEPKVKAYARERGCIPLADGKRYRETAPYAMETFDAKSFKDAHPDLAAQYMRPGWRTGGFRVTK